MNQISVDHEKLRTVLISKLGLPTDRFQRDNEIAEAVGKVIKERDEALKFRDEYHTQLMEVATRLGDPGAFFSSLPDEITKLHTEMARLETARDTFQRLDGLVITDMDGNTLDWELSEGVVEIPHPTQPQLSETRYVLHGDIQPCSVLYSDDTTTLLRLDGGDIMCETDTVEWSDLVTYRCQELLKSAAARLNTPVTLAPVKLLAQLVRDERILLNDNGDDEVKPEEFGAVADTTLPKRPAEWTSNNSPMTLR